MEKSSRTLIVGPYVGELGHELFGWQPLIRNVYLEGGFDKCVVFGSKGKSSFYDFAEYREVEIPSYESECFLWTDMNEEKNKKLNELIQNIVEPCKKEFGQFQMFWYNNLNKYNDPQYMMGKPNLIHPNSVFISDNYSYDILTAEEHSKKNKIVFCVRNREMSTYRNMNPEDWVTLVDYFAVDYNCIVIGRLGVNKKEDFDFHSGVVNLLNETNLDDCVYLMNNADLVVGGSTGLMHLASRMGKNHLVWGTEKNVVRYNETNWFGAKHKVYELGWLPNVSNIVDYVDYFMKNGEFKNAS